MNNDEINGEYELNTGRIIVETLQKCNYANVPAVLVYSHGPFVWGADALEAVHNAVVLEEIAMTATITEQLGGKMPIQQKLLERHYLRKHGTNTYYGQ